MASLTSFGTRIAFNFEVFNAAHARISYPSATVCPSFKNVWLMIMTLLRTSEIVEIIVT